VPLRSTVLLTPSRAAAVELPRRLALTGRAVAGLYPMTLMDLARAVAEPALLGQGLAAWDGGHGVLLAARLLEEDGPGGLRLPPDVPRRRVAPALAHTLAALRRAGLQPRHVQRLADRPRLGEEDARRLQALARFYRRFHETVEGHFADPAAVLWAAAAHLPDARWLEGASVLIPDDLELDAAERSFLSALARAVPVRRLARERPAGLARATFGAWAEGAGISTAAITETALGPLAPPPPPAGLARLRAELFEPFRGEPVHDGSVVLLTAPGEAAEVRAIVRRLLREARQGVPFEEMGVILPRPEEYAPLLTDLLGRLGIPHRLHPSLPLRYGRAARSLLLLLRCRELPRSAVMEFLTFAPVPFEEILGEGEPVRPAQWDALSREASIVSGLPRWIIGLRAYAEEARLEAEREDDPERRTRGERRSADAERLLRVVELLSSTLEALSGTASWPEWSERLASVVGQWLTPRGEREERLEHQALLGVIADLAGLGSVQAGAAWAEVEEVLEARLEWERLPLERQLKGAVHVGALDAMAGLDLRVVAIPGLVEGGYPGVMRPDPFLLDREREALASGGPEEERAAPRSAPAQLSLFAPEAPEPASPDAPAGRAPGSLSTTRDQVLEARRLFHRALRQATSRLILSYPRADPRTGRERLPSLFFVAAASVLEGRPLGAAELERLVSEDDLDRLAIEDAMDASERDRMRVRQGGAEAVRAVAAGSTFFRGAHLAARARFSDRLTAYDGLVAFAPGDDPETAAAVRRALDPVEGSWSVSASRLATYARCGFQYLLQYVLRLAADVEPAERLRLEPLERGDLFHRVAETFLRALRERGELPLRDTAETRRLLAERADEELDALVAACPPRFTALWEKERARFHQTVRGWLEREAAMAERATPAHFEVSFGPNRERAPGEPHLLEPVVVDLGDGRTLRLSGKIDRIDRRPDGTLVLRDYKTGRAPRDDGGTFRGGRQLQIPFYVLAAARIFPDAPVREAFLDFVDGGRRVAFDPERVHGEELRELLRLMVDAVAEGIFAQEPSNCDICDFTEVCGPKPLLERRRSFKVRDPRLQRVLRLRDYT
jgi:ATP-dependent helicase/nuclease subunit B